MAGDRSVLGPMAAAEAAAAAAAAPAEAAAAAAALDPSGLSPKEEGELDSILR